MSRALGDFVFKKNEKKPAEEQIVTAYPDVTVEKISTDHEFLILACDGIWDVLSNQEVVDFVRGRLAQKMEPHLVRFIDGKSQCRAKQVKQNLTAPSGFCPLFTRHF